MYDKLSIMNRLREMIEEIKQLYESGGELSKSEILEKHKSAEISMDGVVCPCLDCGKETIHTDYYMLNHELWADVVPESVPMTEEARKYYPLGDGCYMCLDCLEIRLGRNLNKSDFVYLPSVSELDLAKGFKPSRKF